MTTSSTVRYSSDAFGLGARPGAKAEEEEGEAGFATFSVCPEEHPRGIFDPGGFASLVATIEAASVTVRPVVPFAGELELVELAELAASVQLLLLAL